MDGKKGAFLFGIAQNMMIKKIVLGDNVKCKYTGLIGIAVQRIQYLDRDEDSIVVQVLSTADNGSLPALEYIQENWLEKHKKSNGYHQTKL